ncbi:MAG: hypothetical protein U9Q84_01850 [Thermodesulfobacteriota bacterium]|nr:hypothetical protein [Thermodesulfobacteriota bacterium]
MVKQVCIPTQERGNEGWCHHIYVHRDVPELINLHQDVKGKAKPYQVKQLLQLVEKYNLQMEDE